MTIERVPGEGKYAHLERERRWLLSLVPPQAQYVADITDHYVIGTTLRIRKITSEVTTTWKLTQKVRMKYADPEFVKTTTIYLTGDEFRLVAQLDSKILRKTRHRFEHEGHIFSVDVFDGRHVGLVLAEIEIDAEGDAPSMPVVAAKDVTNDERFSGASLAFASDRQLRQLITRSS